MDYEQMWNKLKSTLTLTHDGFIKKGKHGEAGTLEFVLDEMMQSEESEEVLKVLK